MKLRALTAFVYGDGPIIQNSEFEVENQRHAMSLIETGVAEAAVKLSEPPPEEESPAQESATPVESTSPEVKHKSKKK